MLPAKDPWASTPANEFEALAREFGTPFYLYDADDVRARIRAVRDALGGRVQVYYAVKANPNLELLKAVRSVADGLDISSGGELEQAMLAGFDGPALSFAGPAKTDTELMESVRRGVGHISVESLRELNACVAAARATGRRASITLRVNPQRLNRAFGMKMGGRATQFGNDEESLGDILPVVAAHADVLDFQGIHVYAGSQCFDAAGLAEGVADTIAAVRAIENGSPLYCAAINFGGGFGLSHVDTDKEMGLAALGEAVRPLLDAFMAESPRPRKLVFELGRYLTANAGIYVARVVSRKSSRGKHFILADGGLHHHLAAAGTFGAALRSNFILRNLSRPDAARITCSVAGPSCNPTDLLGIDVELPEPQEGDLIGVLKSGAYGLTASPILFLGRQTPAELVRVDGRVILGRRARPMTDFN